MDAKAKHHREVARRWLCAALPLFILALFLPPNSTIQIVVMVATLCLLMPSAWYTCKFVSEADKK